MPLMEEAVTEETGMKQLGEHNTAVAQRQRKNDLTSNIGVSLTYTRRPKPPPVTTD